MTSGNTTEVCQYENGLNTRNIKTYSRWSSTKLEIGEILGSWGVGGRGRGRYRYINMMMQA